MDRARMAHPRAPDRTWNSLRARRRQIRRRCRGWHAPGADLRCRGHRRPMGDAAAGYAQRRRAAARLRGLRSLVCACASLSRGPRGDSRVGPRSSRHQGRQHMYPLCAGEFRSRRVGRPAARHIRASCAHRFRVFSRVARKPRHAVADWLAEGLRLPVAAPPHRARVRPRRQPSAYAGTRLAL